jgi:biotin carboxylase
VKTILIVGAGRYQRAVIRRAKALGLRVVASDRNPDAAGFVDADVACVADFADPEALEAAVRDLGIDGVTTVQAERAVPIIARLADTLGVYGIGVETAHRMTNKLAMRLRLEEAGVPQPRFAALRSAEDVAGAAESVGFPAVVKPVDSSGQYGVSRVESADDVLERLPEALSHSPAGVALLEEYTDGIEMNGIVIVTGGEVRSVTLSDRLRPEGASFGVSWIHLYPPTLQGSALAEAERIAADATLALGLETGIGFPQLITTTDGRIVVVECAARIGGLMAEQVLHARGIDLLEVQLRIALGEALPDELVRPRFERPVAVRFLTAEPGPLTAGRVTRVGSLERVLAAPGVVAAEVYAEVGEVIRPVMVISDRRGWVIAVGGTREEALARAEAGARLVEIDVESGPPKA